jgi:hypothetical protein
LKPRISGLARLERARQRNDIKPMLGGDVLIVPADLGDAASFTAVYQLSFSWL